MNNDFIIVRNMKKFISDLNNIIINYPRSEIVIKNRLLNDSLDILELIYYANYTNNLEKKNDLRKKILSKISMLDYYLERSYENKYISERILIKKTKELNKIIKLIYGWIKSDCKSK